MFALNGRDDPADEMPSSGAGRGKCVDGSLVRGAADVPEVAANGLESRPLLVDFSLGVDRRPSEHGRGR
jgi:hypothetical protein